MGKVDLAIKWAEKSLSVKSKRRTKEYLEKLKERKKNISKLEQQVN
jgi:hypothetical protein